MRKIIFVLLAAFLLGQLPAQNIKKEFADATDLAGTPILVMKDGSVVFISYLIGATKSKERLMIFDKNRKLAAQNVLEFRDFKIGGGAYTMGYYEIGGKIVLFVKLNKTDEEKKCALYRVIINPKTAKIESEEIIEKLERASQTADKPIYGIMDIQHIYMDTEPNSEC